VRTLSTLVAFAAFTALPVACDHQTTPAPPSVAPSPSPSSSAAQASASASAPASASAVASASTQAPAPAPASTAPLGPPGATIAVVPIDGDAKNYNIVVTESGKVTTYQFNLVLEGASPQFRQIDVNGDGRADTVFFLTPTADHPLTGGTAVLTPPAGQDAGDNYLGSDFATTLVAVGAASLDDVVARARAIPAKGVTAAQACAVLRRAATEAGYRAVATPDARIIMSGEPGDPSQGAIATLADIGKPDASLGNHFGGLWPLAGDAREWCKTMNPSAHDGSPACEKNRPACQWGQAEGAVFAFLPDGQLRIQAILSFDM
jgi:hypothetical protein